MTAPRLILDQIRIRYEQTIAIDGLSLRVEAGELFGLLGPNGSGKSSTLSAIAGIVDPFSGTIQINGQTRQQSPGNYARAIGYVPQEPALYDELSIRQNLDFFGRLYCIPNKVRIRRINELLDLVSLTERGNDRLDKLSGGMIRRVNLACALLHEPSVLLLDEPTVALDPTSRQSLFRTLQQLRDQGCAIILTTHHLDEAQTWCDRVGMLRRGRLIAEGKPSEIGRGLRRGAAVHGQLNQGITQQLELKLRQRLQPGVAFEVEGRTLKLHAPDGEQLGLAIAALHAQGVEFDSFRTPASGLESLLDSAIGVGPLLEVLQREGEPCSDR
jgi:ABC-2 type transport system ATP-binding protein